MSDPAPPPVQPLPPQPTPIKPIDPLQNPPATPDSSIFPEQPNPTPTLLVSEKPNADTYARHVLDTPYDGWVFNGIARIRLYGQTTFELADDGSDLTFGTPPDLLT
jgi:hypothetical protein